MIFDGSRKLFSHYDSTNIYECVKTRVYIHSILWKYIKITVRLVEVKNQSLQFSPLRLSIHMQDFRVGNEL